MSKVSSLINTVLRILPDKAYIELLYRLKTGKTLNLKNPCTYTEKLQWIKLYDRKQIYTQMVDKYEAKLFVAKLIGDEYVIPTLGVWSNFDDIDFESLPDRFVLKCTHDSGGLVICKDKATFDKAKAREKINRCLKRNYYWHNREWVYKNIKPRIIAEVYLEDRDSDQLRDYKYLTFHGEPKLLYLMQDRYVSPPGVADTFDMEGNHLLFSIERKAAAEIPKLPQNFEKMKELAAKLSKGTYHLRVDFYEVEGKVYFGELTFFHMGGFVAPKPEPWNEVLGSWIRLEGKLD